MTYYTDQTLFDSKKHFLDERLTCWMACIMSWTRSTPFDSDVKELEKFQEMMLIRKWKPDEYRTSCIGCQYPFGIWNRKHHCRLCGDIFCGICSDIREIRCCYRENLFIRACNSCYNQFTERSQLFHKLQKQWMIAEGKLSDCFLPTYHLKTTLNEHTIKQPFDGKTTNLAKGATDKKKYLIWITLVLLQFIIILYYFAHSQYF